MLNIAYLINVNNILPASYQFVQGFQLEYSKGEDIIACYIFNLTAAKWTESDTDVRNIISYGLFGKTDQKSTSFY